MGAAGFSLHDVLDDLITLAQSKVGCWRRWSYGGTVVNGYNCHQLLQLLSVNEHAGCCMKH